MENNTNEQNVQETQEQAPVAFNQGTFHVEDVPATYSLPMFIVDSNGLKHVGETSLQFVRMDRVHESLMLLGIYPQADGTFLWGYSEGPEDSEPVQTYANDDEQLHTINGILVGNEYLLNIMDGDKPAGIKVMPNSVLTSEGVPYTSEQIANGELEETCTVKAVTLKQVEQGQPGIIVESLLALLIYDLKEKNIELPSRQTSIAVTKLEEALMWITNRTLDRVQRGVVNTTKS
jgi:hypothetical protein